MAEAGGGKYDVVIVGAGFSGSMLAVHLAGFASPPRVALIERNDTFGPGLAYGTASREHLLNVPVEKMGAFPDRPGHFLEWTTANPGVLGEFGIEEVNSGDFLPRGLYGRYLISLVREAGVKTDRLQLLKGEVVDIEPAGGRDFVVHLSDAASLRTAGVVLAWGNFPPGSPGGGPGVVMHNPWSDEARRVLGEPGDVLIIGSGLTCLDLLATATRIGRVGKIHVLSRNGRFPQAHRKCTPRPAFLEKDRLPTSVRELFRQVRNEVWDAERTGGDWRAVVDSLRPFTQDLWAGLSSPERQRFLRHVKPVWEVLRHRAAPAMRQAIDILESRDQLVRYRGRLCALSDQGPWVKVDYRPRGAKEVRSIQVSAVINATGPESDPCRTKSPLLGNLLSRGLVQADPLGLGIRVTRNRAAFDDSLYTLGSLRRGTLWESTAVPELRVQAAEIARRLTTAQCPTDPGHLFLFEI